jgi:glutaredoxin
VKVLTVYSREDCPLCEELLAELAPFAQTRGIPLQIVDVDSDPVLCRRYGLKVPLVDLSGETVCFGHLDLPALEQMLGRR